MASKKSINLTARDYEVLTALKKTPLDAQQLFTLSNTFSESFASEDRTRRRLAKLVHAGLLSCFQFATFAPGVTNYYKLTKLGYHLVEGNASALPPRSFFTETPLALQEHSRAIAAFVVTTHVSAHKSGIEVGGFYRENELCLKMGDKQLKPDCAFQMVDNDGTTFNYLVEIDCGSEPIRSTKQRESLEQKIRFYDAYQDKSDQRFRVLVLFTKASSRMSHFCQAAREVVRNPKRTLFYAGLLSSYVSYDDAITKPLFLDRNGHTRSLLPMQKQLAEVPQRNTNPNLLLANVPTVW